MKCIRMLTFLPLEDIEKMSSWEGAKLNEAKEILAYELTALVHGEKEAAKAKEASAAVFSGGNLDNAPGKEIGQEDFEDNSIDILKLLVLTELAPSRSEARRNVEQGGVSVNGEKVTDISKRYSSEELQGDGLLLKRGKKKFCKVTVK